ncbi:MAG: AAA family ATPase, partial [Minisyncoccia bacterium]
MQRKEIIAITGTLGSGKSSTADLVAKRLGFEHFSSGDFMRKIALDYGISLNELNIKAENNPEIDEKIDTEVKKIGKMNKVVVDSRLAFH